MFLASLVVSVLSLLLVTWIALRIRRLPLGGPPAPEAVIGFGPASVPPKKSATFRVVLKREFRGRKLVIPSSVGMSFAVEGIEVDGEPQVPPGSVPAAVFSEMAIGSDLGMRRCRRGHAVTLKIANVTEGPATFSAALIGAAKGPRGDLVDNAVINGTIIRT